MEVLKALEAPVITAICFGIAFAVKKANFMPSNFLPLLCAVIGCVLGIVSYFVVPGFPATDVVTAVAIGIVSGLAATGSNEAVKQIKEKVESKECSDDGKF